MNEMTYISTDKLLVLADKASKFEAIARYVRDKGTYHITREDVMLIAGVSDKPKQTEEGGDSNE